MLKRIAAAVTALALLAALPACGKREAAGPAETSATVAQTTASHDAEGDIASPQTTQTTQKKVDAETSPAVTPAEALAMDSNTGPLFQKHVREKVADGTYTLRTEQSGMKIVVSVDGDDSAIDSNAAGLLHFSLIHKDGSYYMVMHTTKKYVQMTEEEYKSKVDSVGSSSVDLNNMRFLSGGSETAGGKTFDAETYDEGKQGVVTYFFDEAGVRRTRTVKDGKTSETDVFEVSDNADTSMFGIPSGYTSVSSPAELLK